MSDSVHADYSKIIATTKKPFIDIYEELMTQYANEYNISESIQEKLKAKRAFGLKKYGADSFQSNFENAMASPVGIHLEEELIDAFNYTLHMRFVAGILDPQRLGSITRIMNALLIAINTLDATTIIEM